MEKIYKKDINKVMPILQALAEGKTIQLNDGKKWKVDDEMMVHIRNMEKEVV